MTSSAVTILNTVPSATVSLAPTSPGTNTTLTATATRTDADPADTVNLTYVWKVNGVVKKTTSASSSLTDTFDLSQAGNGDVGDAITVEVTPNDGTTERHRRDGEDHDRLRDRLHDPQQHLQVDGTVNAIVRVGNRVYIGGDFTQLLGHNGEIVPRLNLAALDAATGTPVAWDPSADGAVLTLAASPDGTTIYPGGVFRHLGTCSRERIGAIDATTGAVRTWHPSVPSTVRTITTLGDLVYIGGTFTSVIGDGGQGPQTRTRLRRDQRHDGPRRIRRGCPAPAPSP